MTRWTGPAAWDRREARAGDRLPYARHVDDATIALRDGSLMRAIHLSGMAFETEDGVALDHAQAVREVMLRSVLDARFVIYHHVVRRRVRVVLGGGAEAPFAAMLDARWQERLATRRLFVNEQYLTVVRRPARGRTG